MNKTRRSRIAELIDSLESVKVDIEDVMNEEQEYYDNMPDGIQSSEKGDKVQEVIDSLQEAIDKVNEAVESLNTAME